MVNVARRLPVRGRSEGWLRPEIRRQEDLAPRISESGFSKVPCGIDADDLSGLQQRGSTLRRSCQDGIRRDTTEEARIYLRLREAKAFAEGDAGLVA